jgi:hypothetical protein
VDLTYDIQVDAVHDFFGSPELPSDKARARVAKVVHLWIDSLAKEKKAQEVR